MIEFKNVSKVYPDGTEALKNFDLIIEEGELVVFIGSSGSGKTTSMRMINRMEEPSSGQIFIHGEDIQDKDPVQLRRKIGYVIQSTGLMPHMTVYQNVTMVPQLLNWDEDRMREKAVDLMKQVDMDPDLYFDRYPSELSGGQQQRIGVIRALAADQDVILMDEPFAALDPITRESLQDVVMNLQANMGRTVVFVTHDIDEALKIADKIAILSEGSLLQFGTPYDIINQPANDFVREFIGQDLLKAKFVAQEAGDLMQTDVACFKSMEELQKAKSDISSESIVLVDEPSTDLMSYFEGNAVPEREEDWSGLMKQTEHTVNSQESLQVAYRYMIDHDICFLPVVNRSNEVEGVLYLSDILDYMSQKTWGSDQDHQGDIKNQNIQQQEANSCKP